MNVPLMTEGSLRHHMEDRLRPSGGLVDFEDVIDYVESIERDDTSIEDLRSELEHANQTIADTRAELDDAEAEVDATRNELNGESAKMERLTHAVSWLVEREFRPERYLTREQTDVVAAMEALGQHVYCGASQ